MFLLNSISTSDRGRNRAETNFHQKFCVLREDWRRNGVLLYGAYG